MDDCLHCHMMDAMGAWLNEKPPKSPDGVVQIERTIVVAATVKVLCDVMEATTQFADDGEERVEQVISAFRGAMTKRLERHRAGGSGRHAN